MYYRIGGKGRKYWGKKGAGILYTDGVHILLLRRANKTDNENTWGLPGGKAKHGEAAIDTAKRETKEEIGDFYNGKNFARFDEKDGHHCFTVFLFKIDHPFLVKLSKEHDDAKWIQIRDLDNIKLHPRFEENLEHYLKAIQKEFKFLESFSSWLSINERSNSNFL